MAIPYGYQDPGTDELDGSHDNEGDLPQQGSSRRRCVYILSVVFGGTVAVYLLLTAAL